MAFTQQGPKGRKAPTASHTSHFPHTPTHTFLFPASQLPHTLTSPLPLHPTTSTPTLCYSPKHIHTPFNAIMPFSLFLPSYLVHVPLLTFPPPPLNTPHITTFPSIVLIHLSRFTEVHFLYEAFQTCMPLDDFSWSWISYLTGVPLVCHTT